MKIREKTTAILIAILMISAFAVAIPAMAIEGTHLISDDYPNADEARIVITMPSGFKLGDLDSIAWSEYLVAGYPPHVDVILDLNEDNTYGSEDDALVFEYAYNDVSHATEGSPTYGAMTDAWYATFSDDTNGPASITDTSMAWATKGAPGPLGGTFGEYNFFFKSLADWKAGVTYTADGQSEKTIDSDSIVLRLEIEIDSYIVNTEAYVKAIRVNSQTVTLSGEARSPMVSISVTPTSIDFGTIVLGKSYDVDDVTIDNTGETDILLSAELYTDDGFYAASLTLDSALVAVWGSTMTELQADKVVDLDLVVARTAAPGVHTATLVFWAEEDI